MSVKNKGLNVVSHKLFDQLVINKQCLKNDLFSSKSVAYCVKNKLTVAHKTYKRRFGKLSCQMSSLHIWFPTAKLPRNWIPQQSAGRFEKKKSVSKRFIKYQLPNFRLTFTYVISALQICGLKEAQEFKRHLNETKFPRGKNYIIILLSCTCCMFSCSLTVLP